MAPISPVLPTSMSTIEWVETELTREVAASHEAQALRSTPGILEFRSVLQINPQHLQNNLTGTTLMGPERIGVPPYVFADHEKGLLVAFYHLGASLQGHVGILHGGMAAVLLDEVMGRSCFPLLASNIAVTANLNINYRQPISIPGYVVVKGITEDVVGKKARVKGRIEDLDGTVFVEAEALFIDPKFAKSMSKMM